MSEALTPGAMAEKLRRGPDYAIIYGNAAANMLVQLADVEADLQQMREERTAWRVTAENAEAELAALKASLVEPAWWSVTYNGQHCGNHYETEQDAKEAMLRMNKAHPGDVRAVAPLYALTNKDQS